MNFRSKRLCHNSAVATGGGGGGQEGAEPSLTVAGTRPFWFTQSTVFGTSRNDKTSNLVGKRE